MQILRNAVDVQAFINQADDIQVGRLLRQRLMEVEADGDRMEDLARFIVMESGDSVAALEAHLATALTTPSGFPLWEFVEDHGVAFELVFVLSSSGYGALVFVQKRDGSPELLALCRRHAL